jgi:hypothetical protein
MQWSDGEQRTEEEEAPLLERQSDWATAVAPLQEEERKRWRAANEVLRFLAPKTKAAGAA